MLELFPRRGVGPCGETLHATNNIDLNETIKVFLLTDCTRSPPVFVTMQKDGGSGGSDGSGSGGRGNNGYDFMNFILTCIRQGALVAGDVLVLDNAPIHKRNSIMGMLAAVLRAAQVTLVFLPTYSPELNPCELVFAQCKHYLRTDRRMSYPFWYEIARGFAKTTVLDILNYYYKCIWNV